MITRSISSTQKLDTSFWMIRFDQSAAANNKNVLLGSSSSYLPYSSQINDPRSAAKSNSINSTIANLALALNGGGNSSNSSFNKSDLYDPRINAAFSVRKHDKLCSFHPEQSFLVVNTIKKWICDVANRNLIVSNLNNQLEKKLAVWAWVRLRYGTVRLQYGTLRLQYGTSRLQYGTLRLQNGTLRLQYGTLRLHYGTLRLQYGTLRLQYGTVTERHVTVTVRHVTVTVRHVTVTVRFSTAQSQYF